MKYMLDDKEVEVGNINIEIGEGAYIEEAWWVDGGKELDEKDIDRLTDLYQSEIYQSAYEDMASNAYDYYKDRMKYGDD